LLTAFQKRVTLLVPPTTETPAGMFGTLSVGWTIGTVTGGRVETVEELPLPLLFPPLHPVRAIMEAAIMVIARHTGFQLFIGFLP
jgi:hypothetical protein